MEFLGKRVKCKVTGFEGVCESHADYLNGIRRYSIQPKVKKDGTLPEGLQIDKHQIEIIGDCINVAEPIKTDVNLNNEVIDYVTDFRGIIIGMCVYINGCRRALVAPKLDKDGKYRSTKWFDVNQLRVVPAKVDSTSKPYNPARESGGPGPMAPNREY